MSLCPKGCGQTYRWGHKCPIGKALTAQEPRLAIIGTRPPHAKSDLTMREWWIILEHCQLWLACRLREEGRFVVVTGGAKGIDTAAEDFARENKLSRHVITPNYDLYPGYAAPTIRNGLIVADADEVHAWVKRSRGGTDDAIDKARKLGKPVTVHRAWEE